MPLYTFVCENGHEQEVLCKSHEKDTIEDQCDTCGRPNRYTRAPELIQSRDFGKGAYRMQAVMSDGSKKKLASGGNRGDA